MDEKKLAVVLQTTLEKNGIKKELAEIQKIVNQNMITIVPKLETASLESDLKAISKEITKTLKSAYGAEISFDAHAMFEFLHQELKKISTTTSQISTDLKDVGDKLAESLTGSNISDAISNVANLTSLFANLGAFLKQGNLMKNLD